MSRGPGSCGPRGRRVPTNRTSMKQVHHEVPERRLFGCQGLLFGKLGGCGETIMWCRCRFRSPTRPKQISFPPDGWRPPPPPGVLLQPCRLRMV